MEKCFLLEKIFECFFTSGIYCHGHYNGDDCRLVGQEGQFLLVGFLHSIPMDMQVKSMVKVMVKFMVKFMVKSMVKSMVQFMVKSMVKF